MPLEKVASSHLAENAGALARSIIIGDVHGCAEELGWLLEAVQWTAEDQVYFVGDLVARGPDSRGVLAAYRRLGARGVLGNHEDRLLQARQALVAGRSGPRLGPSHQALMEQFDDSDWQLLDRLPLYLDLPEHGACIVHAGVVPGIPVQQQQRDDLLKMRALLPDGGATSSWRERPWAADYRGPPHIVFGHNALSSLQLYPDATGLDSGCVYGGHLTALVLQRPSTVPLVAERPSVLHSVAARQRYVDFGPRFAGPPKLVRK